MASAPWGSRPVLRVRSRRLAFSRRRRFGPVTCHVHDPYGSLRPRPRRKPGTVAVRRKTNPVSKIGPDAFPRCEGRCAAPFPAAAPPSRNVRRLPASSGPPFPGKPYRRGHFRDTRLHGDRIHGTRSAFSAFAAPVLRVSVSAVSGAVASAFASAAVPVSVRRQFRVGRYDPPSAGASENTAGLRRRAGPPLRLFRIAPGQAVPLSAGRTAFPQSARERPSRSGFRLSGARALHPPRRRSAAPVPPGRLLPVAFAPVRIGPPRDPDRFDPVQAGNRTPPSPFRAPAGRETLRASPVGPTSPVRVSLPLGLSASPSGPFPGVLPGHHRERGAGRPIGPTPRSELHPVKADRG